MSKRIEGWSGLSIEGKGIRKAKVGPGTPNIGAGNGGIERDGGTTLIKCEED